MYEIVVGKAGDIPSSEKMLLALLASIPDELTIRWRRHLTSEPDHPPGAVRLVDTPEGMYELWLEGCGKKGLYNEQLYVTDTMFILAGHVVERKVAGLVVPEDTRKRLSLAFSGASVDVGVYGDPGSPGDWAYLPVRDGVDLPKEHQHKQLLGTLDLKTGRVR